VRRSQTREWAPAPDGAGAHWHPCGSSSPLLLGTFDARVHDDFRERTDLLIGQRWQREDCLPDLLAIFVGDVSRWPLGARPLAFVRRLASPPFDDLDVTVGYGRLSCVAFALRPKDYTKTVQARVGAAQRHSGTVTYGAWCRRWVGWLGRASVPRRPVRRGWCWPVGSGVGTPIGAACRPRPSVRAP
jgi:hypothetical protein